MQDENPLLDSFLSKYIWLVVVNMKRGQFYLLLTFILMIGVNAIGCSAEPIIMYPEQLVTYPAGTEQAELMFSITIHETRDLHFMVYDMEYSDVSFSHGYISGFGGSYSFTQSISVIEEENVDWLYYENLPEGTYTVTLVFNIQSTAKGAYPVYGRINIDTDAMKIYQYEWGSIFLFDETYHGFKVEEPPVFTVDIKEELTTTINIENTGDTSDTYLYRLSYTDVHHGSSDVIQQGATGTMTLTMGSYRFLFPGYYTTTLRVSSSSDPSAYKDILLRFIVTGYYVADEPKSYMYGWVGDDPFNPSPAYSYELGTPKTVDFHVRNIGSASDTAIVSFDKSEYWALSRDYYETSLGAGETYTGSLTATLQDSGAYTTNGGSLTFNFNGKDQDIDPQFRDTWASLGLLTYDLSYTVTKAQATSPCTVKYELTAPNYVTVMVKSQYCVPSISFVGVSSGVTSTIELSYSHLRPNSYTDTLVFTGNGITQEKDSFLYEGSLETSLNTILLVPHVSETTTDTIIPAIHGMQVFYYGASSAYCTFSSGEGTLDKEAELLSPSTSDLVLVSYPSKSCGTYMDTFTVELKGNLYQSKLVTYVKEAEFFKVTPDVQLKYLDHQGKAYFEIEIENIGYVSDSYSLEYFPEGVFSTWETEAIEPGDKTTVTLVITPDSKTFKTSQEYSFYVTSVKDKSISLQVTLKVVSSSCLALSTETGGTSSDKIAVIGEHVEHVFQLTNVEDTAKTYSVSLSGAGLIEGVGDSVTVDPFTSTLLKVVHPSGNEDIFQSTITVTDDGGESNSVTAKTYVVSPDRYSSTTISTAGEHTHSFTIDGYTIDLTIDTSEPTDPFTVSLYQLSQEAHPEISLDGTSLVNGFIHWSDPAPINSISVSVTFDQEQSGDLELLAWTGEEYVSITPKSVNRMKMAWDLENMDAETDNLHSYMMRVKAIDQPIPVPGYIWFIGLAITMVYMTLRKPKTSIL